MSTIDRNARFETLDFSEIQAGIARGRRLQARAMASALKTLFTRRSRGETQKKAASMPDCTAAA